MTAATAGTSQPHGRFREFSGDGHRTTTIVLVAILATDLVFLIIGGLQRFTSFVDNPLLVLTTDGSYPEFFQYLKLFWTSFLLLLTAIELRSAGLFVWAAVFAAFGLDDSLMIHERLGEYLGDRFFDRDWPAGLESNDIGELMVQSALGGFVAVAIVVSLWRGPRVVRRITGDLVLLVVALALFGVVVDFVHALLQLGVAGNFTTGFIEDGGEMIVVSMMCWYALVVASVGGDRGRFLTDFLPFRLLGRDSPAGSTGGAPVE